MARRRSSVSSGFSMEIDLNRADRMYRVGETVKGVVKMISKGRVTPHSGITLTAMGTTRLQVSHRNLGMIEALQTQAVTPIEILHVEIEIVPPGSVPGGEIEIPFEFVLAPIEGMNLHETYHGVYVNTTYDITADCLRKGLFKNNILSERIEFGVEVPTGEVFEPEPAEFDISPGALANVGVSSVSAIPDFRIRGVLHQTSCSITAPLTGELVVEQSAGPIKSVELQLVRVETVAHGAEGAEEAREGTEIQNIQLAEGDVARKLVIPIYTVFPRLFTCPTMLTRTFKVEFECNILVLFEAGHMVAENFPLLLYREGSKKSREL